MQSQLITRLTGIFEFLKKYDKSAPSPVSVKAEADAGVASTITKAVATAVENEVATSSAEANTGVASTIVKAVATAVENEVATSSAEANTGVASTIVKSATAVENAVATSLVEAKKEDKNSEHLSSPLVKEIVTAIATTISQASKTSADAQIALTTEVATLPIETPSSASSPLRITSRASNSPEDKNSAQIAPIVAVVTNAVASSPLENKTSIVSPVSIPSTKVAPTSLTTNLENKLKYVFTYLEKYRKPSIGAPVVTGVIVAPITTTTLPFSETDSTSAINKRSIQTLPSSVTNSTISTLTPVATVPSATEQVATSKKEIRTMNTLGSSEEPHSTEPLSFTGVTTTLVGEKDNKPTQTINTYDFSKK